MIGQFDARRCAGVAGPQIPVDADLGFADRARVDFTKRHGDAERAAKIYAGAEPMVADDIAEAVAWAVSLPGRMNVNSIELMPPDWPRMLRL